MPDRVLADTDMPPGRDRAWSLWQPWASAVLLLGKRVENRGHEIHYRGPAWLHAAKRWDAAAEHNPLIRDGWAAYQRTRPDAHNSIRYPRAANPFIPRGAVIGRMLITGCHHARDCRTPTGQLCDPWAADGQWHTQLAVIRPLAAPVECRGQQGLARWIPAGIEAECLRQLELAETRPLPADPDARMEPAAVHPPSGIVPYLSENADSDGG